jgi:hypothetical protein
VDDVHDPEQGVPEDGLVGGEVDGIEARLGAVDPDEDMRRR